MAKHTEETAKTHSKLWLKITLPIVILAIVVASLFGFGILPLARFSGTTEIKVEGGSIAVYDNITFIDFPGLNDRLLSTKAINLTDHDISTLRLNFAAYDSEQKEIGQCSTILSNFTKNDLETVTESRATPITAACELNPGFKNSDLKSGKLTSLSEQ